MAVLIYMTRHFNTGASTGWGLTNWGSGPWGQ